MKRKKILRLFLIIVCAFALYGCTDRYDYEKAKKEAINFLKTTEIELTDVFQELMRKESYDSDEYQGKKYAYLKTATTEYVYLELGSQGALGGQYWGIIYCPTNDILPNNAAIEIYDESKHGLGNNVFIKEKIKEAWYFYYDDYDGKVDIGKLTID